METTNILTELYDSIVGMPVSVRRDICEACRWSIPTFYRKMKAMTDKRPVSKAESEKILSIIKEFHIDQLNIIKIYENK